PAKRANSALTYEVDHQRWTQFGDSRCQRGLTASLRSMDQPSAVIVRHLIDTEDRHSEVGHRYSFRSWWFRSYHTLRSQELATILRHETVLREFVLAFRTAHHLSTAQVRERAPLALISEVPS